MAGGGNILAFSLGAYNRARGRIGRLGAQDHLGHAKAPFVIAAGVGSGRYLSRLLLGFVIGGCTAANPDFSPDAASVGATAQEPTGAKGSNGSQGRTGGTSMGVSMDIPPEGTTDPEDVDLECPPALLAAISECMHFVENPAFANSASGSELSPYRDELLDNCVTGEGMDSRLRMWFGDNIGIGQYEHLLCEGAGPADDWCGLTGGQRDETLDLCQSLIEDTDPILFEYALPNWAEVVAPLTCSASCTLYVAAFDYTLEASPTLLGDTAAFLTDVSLYNYSNTPTISQDMEAVAGVADFAQMLVAKTSLNLVLEERLDIVASPCGPNTATLTAFRDPGSRQVLVIERNFCL